MTRTVPEWIGKTPDSAIPPRVKDRIIQDQRRYCACGCGVLLGVAGERIEFDHTIALINGGQNREANIQALREPCHKPKTREDVKLKAKIARIRKKHFGLDGPKSKIPYRLFNGDPVYPNRKAKT